MQEAPGRARADPQDPTNHRYKIQAMQYRRKINEENLRLRQAEKELEEATEQASATPEAPQSDGTD